MAVDWPERIENKLDDINDKLTELLDNGSDPIPPDPPDTTRNPSDVLDLRNWTIMLPTGGQGDPDNEYVIGRSIAGTLFVRAAAVVFRAPADGAHSPNSKFARCEAREMRDGKWTKAAWPSTQPRSLECELALDASHLSTRRRLVAMQIHDGSDDVCQVMRHETLGLVLAHNDGDDFELIDPLYIDGQRVTCRLTVGAGRIKVYYGGALKVDIPKTGSGWYFKFGAYVQSGGASEFHEPAGAYGEVVVWRYSTT